MTRPREKTILSVALPRRVLTAFRRLARAAGQSASSRAALLVERDLAAETAKQLAGMEQA